MEKSFKEQLVEWRRYFHMNPESAFEEINTSNKIAEILEGMGLEVHRNIGKTGIVANLTVGDGEGVIGLRADMDCINMDEESGLDYASKIPQRMHACGHDGHITTLLGAAKLLSENKNFNGTVRFIFQPAEEPGKGARAMIDDGLFERFPMDAIYGIHNMPALPAGTFHTKVDGIMASEDNFTIKIQGKGGHASSPHVTIDPLVTAAEVILALQTIVARNTDPTDTAVISCTEIHTDGIHNAIPSNVLITGDTRSFTKNTQQIIEERMRQISVGISETNGATCEFEYTHEFYPTINTRSEVELAVKAAANIIGEDKVDGNCKPMMVSEDFALYLQHIPGCFTFLGGARTHNPDDVVPLHNSKYDYNDDVLEIGAKYFEEIVRISLN